MAIGSQAIVDVVASHALASGFFQSVNTHEPKSAPPNGAPTCAIWANDIRPVQTSGLASTSVMVSLQVCIYSSFIQQPLDAIDPNIMIAVDALMEAYVGDFTLGGNARSVDVRGSSGEGLYARAGYVNIDNKIFRVMTIFLPIIVNDVFVEAP